MSYSETVTRTDLANILNEVLGDVGNAVSTVSVQTTATSVSANTGVWKGATATIPSGYTPIGFKTYGVNHGYINISETSLAVSGTTLTASFFCQNITDSAITCQCDADVLLLKTRAQYEASQPVVLFDNDSTAINVAITLSDSAANYDKLEICYKTNDGFYDSVTVCHPNGKKVALTATGMTTGSYMYLKSKIVTISGTTINTYLYSNTYYTGECAVNGSNTMAYGDYIGITQVIGYKSIT